MSTKYSFSVLCLLLCLNLAYTQGVSEVEFGKNRVQFHQDFEEWSEYNSDNFTTYWYGEGRYIGQAAAVLAEYDFEEIQNLLEHRMNNKIEIIVYSDLTDLKQSNIGVEEAFGSIDGRTKVVDNKIFVYFNGDHNHLRRQIRQGIAEVYLTAMLIGSNLQEIVQNAVMLNLPDWFKQGLVSYAGVEWTTEMDNQLRSIILDEDFKGFEQFAEEDPKLAGHSLWYFVSLKYGKSNVSNLLYITRINRSIESGFIYVLGNSFEKTLQNWEAYFTERYKGEIRSVQQPQGQKFEFKNKRNIPISQVKMSPSGQHFAFVTNEKGKIKVQLHHFATEKTEIIFKKGFRNVFQATDYNYPLLAWSPSSLELAILYEKQDQPVLARYDVNLKKMTEDDLSPNLQRVYSMDYVDLQTLVFSAARRGFSDIFLYFINARMPQPITQDYYDDLGAKVVKIGNRRGIIWASNRPDTLITQVKMDSLPPIQQFDLFYYDLQERSKELVRITNTPFANEHSPIGIDTSHFAYLTDENGIYNRQIGYLEDYIAFYERIIELTDGDEIVMHSDSTLENLDSTSIDTTYLRPVIKQRAINHFASNYGQSILEQSMAVRRNQLVELVKEGNTYNIYIDTLTAERSISRLNFTLHRTAVARQNKILAIKTLDTVTPKLPPKPTLRDTTKEENTDYIFQTPYSQEEETREEEYFFQSEFDVSEDTASVPQIDTTAQEVIEEIVEVDIPSFEPFEEKLANEQANVVDSRVHDFKPGRITPYRIKFRTNETKVEVDNSQLFDGLNSFLGIPEDFGYPPPGILSSANFKDLFEDYVIEGGVRIPTSFNGTEWFLIVDDRKKRLDKRYAFYRRNLRFNTDSPPGFGQRKDESQIILGQYTLRYPLDIYRSFRARTTVRVDVNTPLATDSVVINSPVLNEQRVGLRLEYVFDNTLNVSLNIKNGTQYKIYGEIIKRFNLTDSDLTFNDGFMTQIGFDFRHFQRLDRRSIFAVRVAGATTFGAERILYRIGGVDNWLLPSFNENIPQPTEGNFAYRTDINNLRGFPLNIRNGSSYVLINNELRVPFFKYFTRPDRTFLQNIQLIGFFDVGTAWTGANPFTEESPLNTSSFRNGPVEVKVNFFRDPVVAGYGFGVRAVLFGYFIRVDRGWGIETREVQEPRWFIALGLDF